MPSVVAFSPGRVLVEKTKLPPCAVLLIGQSRETPSHSLTDPFLNIALSAYVLACVDEYLNYVCYINHPPSDRQRYGTTLA